MATASTDDAPLRSERQVKSPRLLLAGRWTYEFYEPVCARALERCGVEVIPFRWGEYLKGVVGRAEEKWVLPGPVTTGVNRDFAACAAAAKPSVVLVWRGTMIHASTLQRIRRETGALLVSYLNDDPFAAQQHGRVPWHHHRLWKHYLASARACDLNFVYRPVNVAELLEAGASHAQVLKPYFVPDLHRPIALTADERRRYKCDVVFVGHYEDDGRLDCLKALVHAGLHVKLFGPRTWNAHLGPLRRQLGEVDEVIGLEYAKALQGAHVALCFLSRLNRDTYTRRCFEIPACGGLLLSERTDDLLAMYQEGHEAIFFSGADELVEKALWLKENPTARDAIAEAGRRRVRRDAHSVDDRMRQFLGVVQSRLTRAEPFPSA